ncbi:MAG TPA: TonB-dependent receptor plug domain-containing protein [Gemmatimonadales bacterium]|nr:TonB-dependent receptor plug domain-containing protein [Gemmatimonadales bacterium]
MRSWIDGRPVDRGDGGRRVLRPSRFLPGWALFVWVALAHGGARAGLAQSHAPSAGRVITADAIAKSGARTAWDAVRFTVPNVQLREVRGEPARIQRRGRASLYQDDQVRVILDHLPIDDLQVLKQIAAADILTIEILTGLDATTQYGAASTSGAIVITTTSGRP